MHGPINRQTQKRNHAANGDGPHVAVCAHAAHTHTRTAASDRRNNSIMLRDRNGSGPELIGGLGQRRYILL